MLYIVHRFITKKTTQYTVFSYLKSFCHYTIILLHWIGGLKRICSPVLLLSISSIKHISLPIPLPNDKNKAKMNFFKSA